MLKKSIINDLKTKQYECSNSKLILNLLNSIVLSNISLDIFIFVFLEDPQFGDIYVSEKTIVKEIRY